jgi:hypothetical protein
MVLNTCRFIMTRRAVRPNAMIGLHRYRHTAAIADKTPSQSRNLRSKQRKHCKQHSEARDWRPNRHWPFRCTRTGFCSSCCETGITSNAGFNRRLRRLAQISNAGTQVCASYVGKKETRRGRALPW